MVQNVGKPKRDELVDCLKGYACLLVVFGHIIMGIRKSGETVPFYSSTLELFIWSFHVGLFMFLSGYVYHITGEWKSKSKRVSFIIHKFLNLAIPYFVFATIYIFINSIIPGVNNEKRINDIILLWKEPIAQYWFLYTLFFLFKMWTILSVFFKNWHITVILTVFYYIFYFTDFSIPILGKCLAYAFTFGVGTCISHFIVDKIDYWKRILILLLHMGLEFIFIYINLTGKPFIDDIEECIGIVASISFISMIINFKIIKRSLLFFSKYSFPIYLLHTIFTSGIRIALNKIGIHNYYVHILFGICFGVGIPIIIALITNYVPLLDFFFYPTKNLKRMKKKLK